MTETRNTATPFFSIIVPVFNSEATIEKCFCSLVGQSFKNFEILIVDDGSTDKSAVAIQELIRLHPKTNARLFRKKNSGAGETRNYGIDKARGEFLVFVDSDDYIDSDYLRDLFHLISTNNYDLVFIDLIREKADGSIIRLEKMSDYKNLSKRDFLNSQLTGKIPWGGVRKVVRTSVIKEKNIRYGSINVGEESIFSFQVLDNVKSFGFLTTSFYHYVINEKGLTSSDVPDNPKRVFSFIRDSLIGLGKDREFEKEINALAVTTAIIIINLIIHNKGVKKGKKDVLECYKEYKCYIKSNVNKKALERRVRLCYPFLKIGFLFPIMIASRLLVKNK